jgi:hypothetical protein
MATSCCEGGDVTPVPGGGGTLFGVKRAAVTVLLAALGAGCLGASEEEVRRKFDAYVNGANSCSMVSECAAASAGCPLGCEVAVRQERVADVEAKARELIKDYERGGRRCDYECRPRRTLVCEASRCAIVYDGLTDAGGD